MNSAPINALLVAHNGGLFGAERSLLSLARGLRADPDFEPLVLVPDDAALARRCRELGIAVAVASYRQWTSNPRRVAGVLKRRLRNLVATSQLQAPLRRFAPQVVYTGTGTTDFGAAIAREFGIAHVWHLREFGERDYGLSYDLGRRRSWRRMARADQILANTRAVRDYFAPRLERADIQVVYNGFEFAEPVFADGARRYRARVASGRPVKLLMLGALVEGKGQHDAIAALAQLPESAGQPELVLAGDGDADYIARLKRLARDCGVEQRVNFAGFVDDPAPLYEQAALTLICSRAEGFGRTAVEAASRGIPVVGTDAGGLPEVLRDGDTGLLYPPGDSAALATAMARLLGEPDLYARVAEAGSEQMRRRFGMQRYVNEIAAALGVAARRQPQPAASNPSTTAFRT